MVPFEQVEPRRAFVFLNNHLSGVTRPCYCNDDLVYGWDHGDWIGAVTTPGTWVAYFSYSEPEERSQPRGIKMYIPRD